MVTDPIKLIRTIIINHNHSPFLIIGGDRGNKLIKIGITYLDKNENSQFIPIMMIDCKENYKSLTKLKKIKNKFKGESQKYRHIWKLLKALLYNKIDNYSFPPCYINGDLKWLSTIMGLKCCASHYPCSSCLIISSHVKLLKISKSFDNTPRTIHDPQGKKEFNKPLLFPPSSSQIVPPVLHIYLGIGNKILKVYKEWVGTERFEEETKHIKSQHERGGGKQELFEFNGNELRKFVDDKIGERFYT